MNVSLICACKNRNAPLQISLSSWLLFEEIKEIIIVDWSSDESIEHLIKLDSRIKVVTVPDQKYFNQPQPLNLAVNISKCDYILKVDTDYIINPYFNFFETYKIDNYSFLCGQNDCQELEIKSSPYFKYLRGLLFVSRENYLKVGGYNEIHTQYYAYEDDEIVYRLELLGLQKKKICYNHHIIHIPHPDKKRVENFEAYHTDKKLEENIRQMLSTHYNGEELEWQVEYVLAQEHIEINRQKSLSEIVNYYFKSEINWNVKQTSKQTYIAMKKFKNNKNKLNNFPTGYYISLEESYDRQKNIIEQFNKYKISLIPIISKRFSQSDDNISGKYLHQLNNGTAGCCVSHLKAIKQWYDTTDEDYAFFCEDDLSLETVCYWDFTWDQFIESLPEDAECVQLLTIRDNYDTFELRIRYWDDWGASAYIITRDYAKKIIDTFIKEDHYLLEVPDQEVMPLIENILFSSVGKTYTIPLFVEEIKFKSTFSEDEDSDVNNYQKKNHYNANQKVLKYWKKNISSNNKESYVQNLLTKFSLDTENGEHNFNLGIWYENQGHTAPALSYYLRCAERSEDHDLAYEALIRGSYCYKKQGERDGSSRSLLFQAQAFRPDRPEAYFLLSRYSEERQWWQDCYINADLALRYCNFEQPPLKTDVEYPGKYGLLFEKAISGWWWGKNEESKFLFLDILNSHKPSDQYRKVIIENLIKMGVSIENSLEFSYPQNFDWGSLQYEDIVTIEREIIHEKVYRFWRDVKKDDIVLDIGSSVGAYTISILDQKPKKVYCVEPSKKSLDILAKNCEEKVLDYDENPLVYINYGIISNDDDKINIFGGEEECFGITFKKIINDYSINHVNFMKIDCEGGEYNIFNIENIDFLKTNVDFISMEIHLKYPNCREKFKIFRDKFLTQFKNYKVMSCTRQNISWGNSLDIKENIFDDDFIDNYNCEFMIYISNTCEVN